MAQASSSGRARRGLPLACLALGATYFVIFSVPPLINTFVDVLGFSHAEAGGLMAAFTLAYCAGSLPAGRLADRWGAARVMAVGVVVAGLGSVLGSLTELLVPLLVTRAVVGIGDALVWTAGVIYVLQVLPPARRSAGVGWFSGALAAGVALAFLLTPMLEGSLGWRGIFAAYGVAGIAVGLAVLAAIREEHPAAVTGAVVALGGVLRERRLLLLAAALFLGMAALYGPLTWIQPFLDEVGGFSSAERGVAGLLISAAAIPGPILAGIVAGRTGRPVETFAAFLALSVPVLLLALGTERQYVLITLVGALSAFGASGAVTPLFAAVGTVVRPEAAGTAAGIATTIAMAGTVAASYLGGLLVSFGGYDVAFVAFAALAAAGVVIGVPAARRALSEPAVQS